MKGYIVRYDVHDWASDQYEHYNIDRKFINLPEAEGFYEQVLAAWELPKDNLDPNYDPIKHAENQDGVVFQSDWIERDTGQYSYFGNINGNFTLDLLQYEEVYSEKLLSFELRTKR